MKKTYYNLLIFWLLSVLLFAQQPFPDHPLAWVNDYVDVLNNQEEKILNDKLRLLQEQTSTQMFIAIIDRLPENTYLEDFAEKLFKKWGPGREKEDNGVLIVVFTEDRQIRIEVGYGLEGALTDLQAGRVIEDFIKPGFRDGSYYNGLNSGVDVIIAAIKGEYKIPTKSPQKKSDNYRIGWLPLLIIIFIVVSIVNRFRGGGGSTISGKGSRYRRGGLGGPVIFGGGSSGGFGGFSSGGGFSGGFGGLSGGGGASGSW